MWVLCAYFKFLFRQWATAHSNWFHQIVHFTGTNVEPRYGSESDGAGVEGQSGDVMEFRKPLLRTFQTANTERNHHFSKQILCILQYLVVVTNKHVLQKQKKCAGKINSGANKKRTVRASIREAFKNNKRTRNDRTRLLQEVRAFHKRYFAFRDCMESEQIWTFRHNGIRKHLTTTRGGRNTPMTSRYTTSLFRYQPRSFANEESSEVRGPGWWKKFASPKEIKLVVERGIV